MATPATPGEALFDLMKTTFSYELAPTVPQATTATYHYRPTLRPTPDRLPAFVVHSPELRPSLLASLKRTLTGHVANGTIQMLALEKNIDAWGSLSRTSEYFAQHPIKKEADVTSVGTVIFMQLQTILRGGFNFQLKKEEQPSWVNPRPDRFLSVADIRRLMWEDKSWKVFEAYAPEILKLAKSAEGLSLTFRGAEEHGRAILYKLSVAMFDANCHWSLLFGGNSSLIIQRVPSTDPTRYGLICSDLTSLSDLFLVVLGILLIPGNASLVDLAKFKIPVAAAPPRDTQVLTRQNLQPIQEDTEESSASITNIEHVQHVTLNFCLAGYEHELITVDQRRVSTAFSSSYLESPPDSPPLCTPPHLTTFAINYFEKEKKPTVQSSPPRAVVPVLNVTEYIMPGATGLVFRATLGSMPLVIKAIPPGWEGVDDLYNEAVVYEALASLQGIALPRSAGLFEGHGWLIIILEDVGRPVTALWQQACAIHASGVLHHDLELRNLVVSSSGEVRIVDYAYARLGHQCDTSTCIELERFRGLLDNDDHPS